jgi:membrane associated rhomboid family serine protease
MKHYFRVSPAPINKRSLFSAWLSDFSITGWLILVTVIASILQWILSSVLGIDIINNLFALQANNIFNNGHYWTLLTSMFMHVGPLHLFVNMFSLFFIGRFLETLIGRKRFFWMYIFSGIFAGLFFAGLSYLFGENALGARIFGSPEDFAVGASGAIFAIAGVLALLTPKNRVYLIAGPLIAIILQAIIAIVVKSETILSIVNIALTFYIFLAIFSLLSFNRALNKISLPIEMPFWLLPIVAIIPLAVIGLFFKLPIGNMAHLGGFIAGALYGIYLRLKYKRKTRMISEYFSR